MSKIKQLIKNWKKSEYNTNNGWGFGGVRGTRYQRGKVSVIIGESCYRHADSTPYIRVQNDLVGETIALCRVDGNGAEALIKLIKRRKTA